MSWLTSIFSGGVDKVATAVADWLDKLFTSDRDYQEKAYIVPSKQSKQ